MTEHHEQSKVIMAHKIDAERCNKFVEVVKDIPNWFSSTAFNKKIKIRRLELTFSMQRSDGFMGRFGGGWNWKIGFQAGGRTVIISLLIMDIRIYFRKP